MRKGSSLRQQSSDCGSKEIPPHGRGVLCIDMGNLALQAVFALHTFHFENGPQAP